MTLAELHRQRPQNHFVRGSALAFVGLVLWSWGTGAHSFSELATPRALRNLGRFLGEIQPTLTIAWWREAVPLARPCAAIHPGQVQQYACQPDCQLAYLSHGCA